MGILFHSPGGHLPLQKTTCGCVHEVYAPGGGSQALSIHDDVYLPAQEAGECEVSLFNVCVEDPLLATERLRLINKRARPFAEVGFEQSPDCRRGD